MQRFARSFCAAVALLASAASAFGQSSILQGGTWTPGHSPMYVGTGSSQPIVQDSGPASGGAIGLGLAEQLLTVRSPTGTYPAANAGTGPLGANWCNYDAPITNATGYHYLCLSPNAQGGGLLAYGFGGGASALPFTVNVNGISYAFPFAIGGIIGPGTTAVNDFVLWNNTTGTLVKDGGAQIGTSQIANNAVTSTQIAAGAVGTTQLAASSVATGNIQAGAVGTTQIANNAVGSAQIANGGVGTTQLAAGAVTQPVLAADATFWRTAAVNDTILNTDCWKTVAYGGNAFFTITLPSVAGFPAGCKVRIKNSDTFAGAGTGRGKRLSGFPGDLFAILYPQQALEVQIVNGAWVTTMQPGRWRLPTSAELCVAQNGVDTNDGLGVGTDCLASIQTAVTTIGQQWDGTGYYACNVGIYSGGTNTFSGAVSMTGQQMGCYLTFNWRGATIHTSTGPCFTGGDNGIAIFNMNLGPVPVFQCNTANSADNGAFYGHQTVIYDWFGSMQWVPGGGNDNFIFMDAQGRGVASFNTGGGLVIGDGAVRTFNAVAACGANCAGVQVSGTIGCSANASGTNILRAKGGSWMNISVTFAGCGAAFVSVGAATSGNSVIKTNGITFPATTQTTTATGGQICTADC